MRFSQNVVIAVIVGLAAAGFAFWKQAGAAEAGQPAANAEIQQADAIFAGGCFWCVESDFDKLDGVLGTVSGYTGGTTNNPSYEEVSYNKTGHYEAVRVVYDANVISYAELLEYYWRHVDPTDPFGQFCDKGASYRTAIFVETEAERELAENSKAVLDGLGTLPGPIVTEILDESVFWPAEDYHQNYHQKKPLRYQYYRSSCGRDSRVKKVWKDTPETLPNS